MSAAAGPLEEHSAEERQVLTGQGTSGVDSVRASDTKMWERRGLRKEIAELVKLALPISIASFLRTFVFSTDASFAGRLGTKYLVGSTFAINWISLLSPLYEAPGYVLNTVCSQAIGAGNPKLAGVWLQLGLVTSFAIAVPVFLLYLLTGAVTSLSISDPEIPSLAQTFAYFGIAITISRNLYLLLSEFLQAAQIVGPAVWISVVTVLLNILLNSLLVQGPYGLGYTGVPLSTLLSSWFKFLAFFGFCMILRQFHRPYWGGWSIESFQGARVRRFVELLLPTIASTFLEDSGYILMSFFVGHIGKANVAGLEVTEIMMSFLWAFYWGVGMAIQVRIGTFLGAGDVAAAQRVLLAAATVSVPVLSTVCCLIYIFRRETAQLFSSDAEVIDVFDKAVFPMLVSYAVEVGVLAAMNVLQAMGRQRATAIIVCVTMWGFQLPLAVFCAYRVPLFHDSPVNGVWYGALPGNVLKLVLFWLFVYRTDWRQMSMEAQIRSEAAASGGCTSSSPDIEAPLTGAHSPLTASRTIALHGIPPSTTSSAAQGAAEPLLPPAS